MNDDPQMNAVSLAALLWAVEAAGLVGFGNESEIMQWEQIADRLVIPYDVNLGVHIMPNGTVTNPSHYVCPEDINYIGYPLGPSLNISAETRHQDMNYHITKTCLENPGNS